MVVVALSRFVVLVGVPAVAVTAIATFLVVLLLLLFFFIDPLCDYSRRRYLLHKGGTFAAEVECVAGFAIGADEPEAAIAGIERLRAFATLVVVGVK